MHGRFVKIVMARSGDKGAWKTKSKQTRFISCFDFAGGLRGTLLKPACTI